MRSTMEATTVFAGREPHEQWQADPEMSEDLGPNKFYQVPEQGSLLVSLESSEGGRDRVRCPYPACGKVFLDLGSHMLTHQAERPEKCPIPTCEYHIKGFARKYDKQRHTLAHYKGIMVCGFCPGSGSPMEKSFNRADVFKRHLTVVHGVKQLSPQSRKKSPSFGTTKKATNSPSDIGKCSVCLHVFKSALEFYEHLDDCVLSVVQQEEPSEAINEKALTAISDDPEVLKSLERNSLLQYLPLQPPQTDDTLIEEEESEEDEKAEKAVGFLDTTDQAVITRNLENKQTRCKKILRRIQDQLEKLDDLEAGLVAELKTRHKTDWVKSQDFMAGLDLHLLKTYDVKMEEQEFEPWQPKIEAGSTKKTDVVLPPIIQTELGACHLPEQLESKKATSISKLDDSQVLSKDEVPDTSTFTPYPMPRIKKEAVDPPASQPAMNFLPKFASNAVSHTEDQDGKREAVDKSENHSQIDRFDASKNAAIRDQGERTIEAPTRASEKRKASEDLSRDTKRHPTSEKLYAATIPGHNAGDLVEPGGRISFDPNASSPDSSNGDGVSKSTLSTDTSDTDFELIDTNDDNTGSTNDGNDPFFGQGEERIVDPENYFKNLEAIERKVALNSLLCYWHPDYSRHAEMFTDNLS